ncbi:hypothetical protein MMC07_005109 [Pseudocyphellaria aurata]|nr:hypothetical protein [Pseudocyphellaria aurata]
MSAPDTDANYNRQCLAVSRCNSGCDSLRKVVSHVFGRNKTCTMQIPESCTISWCRQHYQRFRYRSKENWIKIQIDIIRRQLDRIENWGGAMSWTIDWGKGEKEAIDVENAVITQRVNSASYYGNATGFTAINQTRTANALEKPFDESQSTTSSIRFLQSHMGAGKSINEVRATVDAVEKWAETPNGFGEDFPHIEFLPDIDKVLYPPISGRKGQKPLASATSGPSSSPALKSASTTVKDSLESPRKNPARGVKRSARKAFEDEAADAKTDEDMTAKRNISTRRPQLQANQLTATPKASPRRNSTQKKSSAGKKCKRS